MQRLPLYLSIAALIMAATVLVMSTRKAEKIAYVNIETLYNDFQMKQELEGKFKNVQNMRTGILDSLELQLKLVSQQITSPNDKEGIARYQMLRQNYAAKENEFAQSNEETMNQYGNQIWKQLTQYVKQYGKEHGYLYVLSQESRGAVLYGNEAEDITNAVKEYVNAQYKGESK